MQVTLIAVHSDGTKREAPMKHSRIVIGRKEGCSVRVPVDSVSREHCEIRADGETLVVRDLGSSNGTYVNRKRVQSAELSPGDLIGVGPVVFVVQIDGKPGVVDARSAYTQGQPEEPPKVAAAAAKSPPRPAAPGGAKPAKAPAKPAADESDLDMDASEDSSISDIVFDLDDEDEDEKKL